MDTWRLLKILSEDVRCVFGYIYGEKNGRLLSRIINGNNYMCSVIIGNTWSLEHLIYGSIKGSNFLPFCLLFAHYFQSYLRKELRRVKEDKMRLVNDLLKYRSIVYRWSIKILANFKWKSGTGRKRERKRRWLKAGKERRKRSANKDEPDKAMRSL